MLLGPWLGWQVRRRGWAPAREWAGLCAAVALAVATTLALHTWGGEPLKHWLAERLGQLDAQGQRPRVALIVGVTVGTPPDGRPRTPNDPITAVNYLARGTLAFLLAGGLGLLGWRRERAGLAALTRERELAQAQAARREAELRLSVLAAQVEPHFLFNTLAGVRSAIATDPPRASEMIDRLVDYLRASIPQLRSDGSAQATLGGQFDSVRAYLGLMAARMPRLAWEVQAPPELLPAHTPPLMLISLVENAVKHGVEPKIGPARIEVRAARGGDGRLAITVTDDGVGFGGAAGSAGSGIGLANIRERLAQLYGSEAALTLQARPAGGVVATLSLPLEWPAAAVPAPAVAGPATGAAAGPTV
jgi:signal transduction histidine kinase